jgi:RNA polymerase sigma-70 factor (ECF subfamily)
MDGTLTTQPSLLLRIRDPRDAQAWGRFVELYSPFLFSVCKQQGLQSADAADVTQEVMRTVAVAIPRFRYDPDRGAFRNWLFTVARSRINDFFRARRRQPVGTGESAVQDLLEEQADAAGADQWERSWRQHVLGWAAERVRAEFEPATWRAFWATAVEGRAVKEVASELGLTAGAVYIARSRVTARLRRVVEETDEHAVE